MKKQSEIVRIDRSKNYLRQWYSQGFRAVKLKLADISCRVCRSVKDAEFFIFSLMAKDNPLYRLTHPNCNCGLVPIDESNIKHEKFNSTTGYKLQINKINPQNTHIAPGKNEPIDEHQKHEQEQKERKIKQTTQEIKTTEDKLKNIEKKEEEATEKGIEPKPDSVKQYLTRYLDQLKKILDNLNKK